MFTIFLHALLYELPDVEIHVWIKASRILVGA